MAVETAKMSRAQFAESLRRSLWGLRRLRSKLAAWTGPESVPAGKLRDALRLVAGNEEAKSKIERAAAYTSNVLGTDWETLIDGGSPLWINVWARIAPISDRPEGPATLKALVVALRLGLDAGHDALEAQTEWKMQRAQEALDFWQRLKELAELPGDVFAAVVRNTANIAAGAAGNFLSTLLAGLKPILPYAAAAVAAIVILPKLGQGGNR